MSACKGLETVEIIGGEEDYVGSRYGFDKRGKGYVSGFGMKTAEPIRTFNSLVGQIYRIPLLRRSLIWTTNGILYAFNDNGVSVPEIISVGNFTLASPPATVRVRKYPASNEETACVVLSDTCSALLFADGSVSTFNLASRVKHAVMHFGRTFAIDRTDNLLIKWSSRNFNDWTQGADKGGSLRLDGDLGAAVWLAEYGNDLIVFCENGFKVIHALGDSRHFSVSNSKFRISERLSTGASVEFCGKLYFGTSKGAYCFDGEKIEKLHFDNCDGEFACRAFFPVGACELMINVEKHGDMSIVDYDVSTGQTMSFGKEVYGVMSTDKQLYAFNLFNLVLLDKNSANSQSHFTTQPVTFGTDNLKYLKSVTLDYTGDFKVEITSENGRREVSGNGRHGVNLSGRSFVFKITGWGEIRSLKAEAVTR